nr:MAG TPA: hypothetical protein [Bacteriophage sp.]
MFIFFMINIITNYIMNSIKNIISYCFIIFLYVLML